MRVHLFGNCQATALSKVIREDHPDWHVTSIELGFPGDDTPDIVAGHLARLAKADIVIAQPVAAWKGNQHLSLDAVKATRKPGSALVVFPSIHFEGLHPGFLYLRHRLDGFEMPYHNVHTVDMLLRRYRQPDILMLQRSPDFYRAGFVHKGLAASLAVLRYREQQAAATVAVSDLLEDACRSCVPMNTINHPKRAVLVRLLNRIYRVLQLKPVAREHGEDHLPNPVIPPLPSVMHHLGLPDAEPAFVTGRGTYTRDEYLEQSLLYYRRLLPRDLHHALAFSRGQEFLDAFDKGPDYEHDAPRIMTAADRDQARQWLQGIFATVLDHPLAEPDLSLHLQAVQEVGVTDWLSHLSDTPVFRARVSPACPGAPSALHERTGARTG